MKEIEDCELLVSGILLEYIIVVCALFDFRMKFYDYLAVDR
jgi:hypothetical protein